MNTFRHTETVVTLEVPDVIKRLMNIIYPMTIIKEQLIKNKLKMNTFSNKVTDDKKYVTPVR